MDTIVTDWTVTVDTSTASGRSGHVDYTLDVTAYDYHGGTYGTPDSDTTVKIILPCDGTTPTVIVGGVTYRP